MTRRFFADSWGQYDGVTQADSDLEIIATTAHSVWVKVGWSYGGEVRGRFIYQLVRAADGGWQIAVLTPLI